MDNGEKLRVVFWIFVMGMLLWFSHARADCDDESDSPPVMVYHLLKNHRMSNGFQECTWSKDICVSVLTRA